MADKKELNTIKAVLIDQGRSQSWLASKMGLNYNTVNGWCNNRNQPTLKDLLEVAVLLEVAPVDLIADGSKKGKGLSRTQAFTEFS